MCDEWMPVVRIRMKIAQFHQLPRHPAYKYEYFSGEAVLSPRAKFYHAWLDVAVYKSDPDLVPTEKPRLRQVRDEDFPLLEELFRGAFARLQPFASLDNETFKEAAHKCLERTRTGGDGPWLRQASLVARAAKDDQLIGASFITLLPDGEATDYDSFYWNEQPADDLLEKKQGRPHLTWIFVHPFHAGHGIGTALLKRTARILHKLGYSKLYSTFLAGNESSMLWHWRNGFQLLSYPFSMRRIRREMTRK